MKSRRVAIASAVVVALALATWGRIWLIDHLRDQGWFAKYIAFADRLLAGNVPADRIADLSPAYFWLIVLFRAIGLGVHAIRDVQIAMLTAAALLCALAAKRLGGWVAAITAAVLVLGSRAALVVATEIEPETLILLLNAAAILAVVRRWWIVAGLLIGLSTVARPVGILILIFVALWALMQSRRAAIALVGTAIVPIAIALLVNRAIAGHFVIMTPGGVFYEANNPLATGCAGVLPRIVSDLQNSAREPDYLHVAWRVIASRATGQSIDARSANRYWTAKALAYMRTYPRDALALFGWKAVLSAHHYDIYDLLTTKRKGDELARIPAIPFGVAFALTLAAIFLTRGRQALLPVMLFALATFIALIAFNVTSRQRNALLAPLAILGGAGVAEIVALARARSERALIAFGAVIILIPILGLENGPVREDEYNWAASFRATDHRNRAMRARAQGDRAATILFGTTASIAAIGDTPLVSDETLRSGAFAIAQREEAPWRLFDIAVALEKANAWREADAVLDTLGDYHPHRENRAVSSVSYYRARAALHLGNIPGFRTFIDAAEREAPGDPNVLALRAITVDPEALRDLDAIHDPFTRDHALAVAYIDIGNHARAVALLRSLVRRFPEWKRPSSTLRHALRTASPRSGSSGAGR